MSLAAGRRHVSFQGLRVGDSIVGLYRGEESGSRCVSCITFSIVVSNSSAIDNSAHSWGFISTAGPQQELGGL